jgi:hypothetical protein
VSRRTHKSRTVTRSRPGKRRQAHHGASAETSADEDGVQSIAPPAAPPAPASGGDGLCGGEPSGGVSSSALISSPMGNGERCLPMGSSAERGTSSNASIFHHHHNCVAVHVALARTGGEGMAGQGIGGQGMGRAGMAPVPGAGPVRATSYSVLSA